MHLSKTRFFDISTSRTAFESLLQNRDLLAPEFLKEAKLATYTENESNLPPSSVTVTILLIGIVAQCTQRNEKATIIVHKERALRQIEWVGGKMLWSSRAPKRS